MVRNLNKKLRMDFKISTCSELDDLPFWKFDKILHSIKEVDKYVEGHLGGKLHLSDSYNTLERIDKRRKSVIYTLSQNPGSDSISAKNGNYDTNWFKIKVTPKLILGN